MSDTSVNGSDQVPAYPIGSVDNALKLLSFFSEKAQVRVSEASRELGVSDSTAHRLMQMLRYHNYVQQDPSSKAYIPGAELERIGLAVIARSDLRSTARAFLEELVGEVEESVHLGVLQEGYSVVIDSIESPKILRIGSRTGYRHPAHTTAAGKVLLAALSEDALRRLLPEETLSSVTPKTTTSRFELEEKLAEVRELGYAQNFGESEADVHAVAVPVVDRAGNTRASVSVLAPPARMTEADVPRIARIAAATAAKIGASLPA